MLEFASDENITYAEIMRVLREKDKKKFKYTIEFYPEEGKYHFDGHRDCHFFCAPEETKKLKGICPKCKRPLTVGVMNRVHELSDRDGEEARRAGVIPFLNTVPLLEIIAGAFNLGVGAKRVQEMYLAMTRKIGNELDILTRVSLADILVASNKEIANAIDKARHGDIQIRPGYDGEFGEINVVGGEKNVRQGALELE